MIRVRFRPVPDRVATVSVWTTDTTGWPLLLGWIDGVDGANSSWLARPRHGDRPLPSAIADTRVDAARHLLVTAGYVQPSAENGQA